VIVGRDAQQAVLTRLVEGARGERASTVSLVGAPGIGKTALIEDTCLRAPADYSVWRVRGVPADQSIAFAALQPVLRELWPHRQALTARQRNSLGHAMGATEDGLGADDLLALGSGVLELLGAAAHLTPILLAIDDAQWLDTDSRALLGFVIRRLGGERVAVLAAAHAVEQLPDSTGLVLELVDLPRVDAAAMVRDIHPNATDATIDRLYELSGGNPLALREMVNQLPADASEAQLAAFDHRILSTRAVSIFAPRISALGLDAQRALLVAACEGRIDKVSVMDALVLRGVAPTALTEVLDAGLLVEADGRLALQHPLVGAAVLSIMSDEEIRHAHAALADSFAASDSERSMWHRAASVATTDETVALDLLAYAQRSQERASYDSARRAAELAANVAASRPTQIEGLVLAAEMALARGDLRQSEVLLTRTRDLGDLPDGIDARCLLASSRIAIRRGRSAAGTRDFLAATLRLPTQDRESLLRELLLYAVTDGDLDLVQAVFSSPGAEALDRYTRSLVEAYVSMASLAASAPVGAAELVSDILDQLPDDADHVTAEIAGSTAVELARFAQARRLFSRAVAASRDKGDLVGLASSTSNIAFIELSVGRWNRAYALGLEVIDLVDEQVLPSVFAAILPLLAEIDAARGREAARTWCRRAHALGQEIERPDLLVLAERREGLLDFGLGHWDAAERRFRAALKEADDNGITHPFFRASPDLVEVLLRQGRREEAIVEAESFLDLVGPGMAAPPLARALRLRGMLSEDGFDDYFQQSLAIDDKIGLAFQGARTRLVYGERLRRERRRSDARAVLGAALDAFVLLDAVPWIDRTSSELAATGGPATVQSGPAIAELLSPQEMQVASLVADGRRNKEIAEQLFMSERTVESHLSRTYRKLGVANRTQLSRAFSGEGTNR
jgi:DNA-binding CsgD family transcriptional regulator/tetratricopeptide (TPR) repeat protein